MKNYLSLFRSKRAELGKQLELEKQKNLKSKYQIIDKIKDLVNRKESINKTFSEFRNLQKEWHATGVVPQGTLKDLWDNYNHNVEIFYDYIKIDKELRDLDFKKNIERKIILCAKAEELINHPNPITAFIKLQEHHQQWREIGPVSPEQRDPLWDRFKEATLIVNKKHYNYYDKQKSEEKNNLKSKKILCEKIEAINTIEQKNFNDWEKLGRNVIQLQNDWREIGFAPKTNNAAVFVRFREGCDKFFQSKRAFYSENKGVQQKNIELKKALCEKAEAMQESTEWKATADEYVKIQKQWKEIGHTHRKMTDKIWKRFRKSCDYFFKKKSDFYSEIDSSYEENLKLKEALIEKLSKFEPVSNHAEAYKQLKSIQDEWKSIGFVPFKKKNEITIRFRELLDKQFDRLRIDEDQKAIIKFQNKLENFKEKPQGSHKLRIERDKFIIRIKHLESDIITLENNIGFFLKSKNAELMIKEVESKIENAKTTIDMLKERVRMIDKSSKKA